MLLSVSDANYIEEYKIEIFFNNGIIKIIDLKNVIFEENRKIFFALRDLNYFKNFQIHLSTIVWENEVEFAPEFVFNL